MGVITSIREEVWMLVDWVPVLCERLCGVYGLRGMFYGGGYVYSRTNLDTGCWDICPFRGAFAREE